MPMPPLGAGKRRRVVSMLRAGKKSYDEIAAAVGVGQGTVSRVAKEEGIPSARARRTANKVERVHAEVKKGGTFEEVAARAGVNKDSARRMSRMAPPVAGGAVPPEPETPFPKAVQRKSESFHIDTPGHWLILSDVHIPQHEEAVVRAAVQQARRDGAVGVILNGDILDCHEISDHDRDPSLPRYVEEAAMGRQFLTWLRSRLPDARVVYKMGNHEERLDRYVMARAPALQGLPGFNTETLLDFDGSGVEKVGDRRVIRLGKLHVLHGHEYRGGGGVNPARWLYLRARSVAVCGHFHRQSEHRARNIADKVEVAWSLGCACDLKPYYAPLNDWGHGFGMVDVSAGGEFAVRNFAVVDGKVT